MTTIRTIVHDRRIEIPAPDDLADGTEVVIELRPACEMARPVADDEDVASMASNKDDDEDDGWDNSPEGIERWIEAVNALEPLIFTDEELAALEADKLAQKQWEKDHFLERADKLAKLWE